jgi:hypothetical protein
MTYLIFVDGGDDAACYHKDRLISMTCAANATLLLHFKSSVGKSDGGDLVTLTITADTERAVMERIILEISSNRAFVIIADDVTSEYIDTRITACAITLDT